MKRTTTFFLVILLICMAVGLGTMSSAQAATTLSISNPDDGEYVSKTDPPKLKWNSVTGAAGYRVTVKNNTTGEYYTQNEWTTSRSYSLENLFEDEMSSSEYPLLKIWVGAMQSESDAGSQAFSSDIIWITVSEYPDVSNDSASDITDTSATLHMELSRNYGSAIVDSGFYLGTDSSISEMEKYSFDDYGDYDATTKGEKSMKITGLKAGTQYYYRAYAVNGVGEEYTSASTFTTKEKTVSATPLKITKQPKNVTVASGKTAKVSVKATGDGLAYVWYYKDTGSSKFSKSSVKTSSYSLTMKEKYDGRQVYCLVTDKYGNKKKSNTATLQMEIPLKITQQPKNLLIENGKKGTVTVKATGKGLKYTWYHAAVGKTKFKKALASDNTYTLKMNKSRAGRQVYCVISDAYGNKKQTKTVTLRMKEPDVDWVPEHIRSSKTFSLPTSGNYTVKISDGSEKTAHAWLTYTINDGKITLKVRANYDAYSRIGTVTVTNASRSKTYHVIQAPGYAAPKITKITTDKSSYNPGKTVTITTNLKNTRRLYIRIYNKETQAVVGTVFNGKFSNSSKECTFELPADIASGSYIVEVTASNSDVSSDPWRQYVTAKKEITIKQRFDPIWPCRKSYRITTLYHYKDGTHACHFDYGIDIAGDGSDDQILACEDGVVRTAKYDNKSGFGYYVVITHNNGMESWYCHLKKGSICVAVGDKVTRGQTIGIMGETSATRKKMGKHLHFELASKTNSSNDPWVKYFRSKYKEKIIYSDDVYKREKNYGVTKVTEWINKYYERRKVPNQGIYHWYYIEPSE